MYEPARSRQYELVVFQKVYDDKTLRLARELKNRGARTVFDLCDNLYHYELGDPAGVRARAERLNRMIDAVDAVSVSTPPLVDVVRSAAGRSAVVIDDAIEEPRLKPLLRSYYDLKARFGSPWRRPFRLVWYGIAGGQDPPYGMIDLMRLLPSLATLHDEIPLSLTVISNSLQLFRECTRGATFPLQYHEWSNPTFPYVFAPHDACVIPVNPNPLTLCKTNNRVVLSLLLGVPVVADRIPSYEEFSEFILFSEWADNLRAYAVDRDLGRQHVEQGRQYIRSHYNKDRVVSQWSSLFRSLLG